MDCGKAGLAQEVMSPGPHLLKLMIVLRAVALQPQMALGAKGCKGQSHKKRDSVGAYHLSGGATNGIVVEYPYCWGPTLVGKGRGGNGISIDNRASWVWNISHLIGQVCFGNGPTSVVSERLWGCAQHSMTTVGFWLPGIGLMTGGGRHGADLCSKFGCKYTCSDMLRTIMPISCGTFAKFHG